jgi:hypothetical protein
MSFSGDESNPLRLSLEQLVLYFRRKLPESPRRLVTQGRVAEGCTCSSRSAWAA